MIGNWNYGTGRRKTSVARVFLKKGSGNIVVNGKPGTSMAAFGKQLSEVDLAAVISGDDMTGTSALALIAAGAIGAVAFTSLWRIEHRRTASTSRADKGDRVPVRGILRTRGVPAGIFNGIRDNLIRADLIIPVGAN